MQKRLTEAKLIISPNRQTNPKGTEAKSKVESKVQKAERQNATREEKQNKTKKHWKHWEEDIQGNTVNWQLKQGAHRQTQVKYIGGGRGSFRPLPCM